MGHKKAHLFTHCTVYASNLYHYINIILLIYNLFIRLLLLLSGTWVTFGGQIADEVSQFIL